MGRRAERTRNGGTWTEAAFWGAVRSCLRDRFKWWKPIKVAKDRARRKYEGEKRRQKWEYQCAMCSEWFKGDEVQVDHIVPCGSLRCYEDIAGFLERLCCEDIDGFRVLCKICHQQITNEERRRKNAL